MGRRPRVFYPGAIYHVMARGVDGRDVFIDDRDRTAFLNALRGLEAEASAQVMAYCLMGNHFHLAIKVGPVPLASIMQRLLTGYCIKFNRRHDRTGHLFQARHKAILCLDDRYLAGLIRYINMNPVRAGLVSAPQDWPWSSFKPAQGDAVDILDFDPWPKDQEIDLSRSPSVGKVDLETVAAEVASRAGIRLDDLRSCSRCRTVVAVRRHFVREAFQGGHALIAVAKWLNLSRSSVSRYARENTAIPGGLTPPPI